jgi:hypothetical protein
MRDACFDIRNDKTLLPLPKPLWAGPLRLPSIAVCNCFSLVVILLFLCIRLLAIDILIGSFLFSVTNILECSKSRVYCDWLLLGTLVFGWLLDFLLSLILDYFEWGPWTFFFYKSRHFLFFIDRIFFIDDEFLPFFFRDKCRAMI